MTSITGGAQGGPRQDRSPGVRLRKAIAGLAGVMLVIGASTIGLHDWADAHLDAPAAHAAPAD